MVIGKIKKKENRLEDTVENYLLVEYIPKSEKGVPCGVATLDENGKVPVSQLEITGINYLGNWDAASNTPMLINGNGYSGDYYYVDVAGTTDFGSGPIIFNRGDGVIYANGIWDINNLSTICLSESSLTGFISI